MEINFKELTLKGDRPLVFILSGAGLSAESGIPTFRDANGLWRKYDPKELASIGALERHTQDVFDFYNERIKNAEPCRPNAAHIAIANFQKEMAPFCDVIHVTQNVDNLNELAGAPRVFHLHGDFQTSLCRKCKKTFPRVGFYEREQVCPVCGATNFAVRPNVVLFGEVPYGMDWIPSYLKKACVFISVGTSGTVYPAANFVRETKASIRINLDLDPLIHPYSKFNHRSYGKCTETLPQLLEELKKELTSRLKEKATE